MAHYRLECTNAADTSTTIRSIHGDAINRNRCSQWQSCRLECTNAADTSTQIQSIHGDPTERINCTDELVSDAWFESLSDFISDEVKQCFGRHTPPTLEELRSLPLHPDLPGVYADLLTSSSPLSLQSPHIYTGCALRPIKQRINEHNQVTALEDNPQKEYYQLRHSTSADPSEFSRHFISLAVIPINGRLENDTKRHHRLLCRIAETFFSIWLMAFDSSSIYASDLINCSKEAYRDSYGITAVDLISWEGLSTHSPLGEQTGVSDYTSVDVGSQW
jgi:hypothetical protein